jgi:hypothetical protein
MAPFGRFRASLRLNLEGVGTEPPVLEATAAHQPKLRCLPSALWSACAAYDY